MPTPSRPAPATGSHQLALFDEPAPAADPRPAALAPAHAPPAAPRGVPFAGLADDASPASAPSETAAPSAPPSAPVSGVPLRHPRARHEVQLGEHRIGYELRRGRRRSVGLAIGPEGLTVSVPRWAALADVESVLQGKARWILRKLHEQHDRARRQLAARIDWREGAAVPFLGETAIVVLDPRVTGAVLQVADDTLPGVPRLALHLGLPQHAEPAQIRDAVQSWLQRQARRVFEERCAIYAARLGVRVTRLALSSASTRWGSASVDGSIRLHWRLVHFGLPIIDYVVAHELAHLREMNHGPAFWGLVRSLMPAYEQPRALLRQQVLPAFD